MCLTVNRQSRDHRPLSRDHRPLSRDPSVSFHKKFPNCLKRPKTLFDSQPTVAWPPTTVAWPFSDFFQNFPKSLETSKKRCLTVGRRSRDLNHCRVTVQRLFSQIIPIARYLGKQLFDSRPTVAWLSGYFASMFVSHGFPYASVWFLSRLTYIYISIRYNIKFLLVFQLCDSRILNLKSNCVVKWNVVFYKILELLSVMLYFVSCTNWWLLFSWEIKNDWLIDWLIGDNRPNVKVIGKTEIGLRKIIIVFVNQFMYIISFSFYRKYVSNKFIYLLFFLSFSHFIFKSRKMKRKDENISQ